AASYPELGIAPQTLAAPAPIPADAPAAATPGARDAVLMDTERHIRGSGSWFYWIAGLSIVNSLAALSGAGWRLIVGLGITQVVDELGYQLGTNGKAVALVLNFVVAGVFVLFGWFACKKHLWAFIVGMIFYGLDGGLMALGRGWLSVAFHAYVLFRLFGGIQAIQREQQARGAI
ncbi:MAG TPA: hypothetical protein VGE41_05770, partial [Verrucomicrobiae bacterium]